MLNLWNGTQSSHCDGVSRRGFLKVGALGAGGLMLPDLLKARAAEAAAGQATRKTSVVWLWLSGGATHIETFDPKMSVPEEFRSMTGATATNVPGIQIGGTFTKLARFVDRLAIVRSFSHPSSDHQIGAHWINTGYNGPGAGPNVKPSHSSILARYRGANHPVTGLPTSVRLSLVEKTGPAWLGSSYAPFDVGGNARRNLTLPVPESRLNDRRALVHAFDGIDRRIDAGLLDGLDSLETQAFNLVLGGGREAFDISREDARTLELYGVKNTEGAELRNASLPCQLLAARRLCEAGVGFVTINFMGAIGGWDMHRRMKDELDKRVPVLDHAVTAFLEDVKNRGLERDILLVITGDFGRTPRINAEAGRDHWGSLSTLALAGGGLKMGQAVGESTSRAEVPKTAPITPQDLMATLFHVLGMPRDLHFNDNTGRPVPMITTGRPIRELL